MSGLFVDDDTLNWYQQQFYGIRPPAPPAIQPEHIELQRPNIPRQAAPEPYWSPRARWYQEQFHGIRPPATPAPPRVTPEHIELQRPNFGPRPPAPAMPQMPRLPVTPSFGAGKIGNGNYVPQQPKAPMMPPSPQMQQPPEIQPEHIQLQRPRMYRPGEIKGPTFTDPRSDQVIQMMADEYNLNPDFLRAIMDIESSGNPRARTGSYHGLFQLSQREGRGDLYDPFNNGREAGKVFVAQIRAFRAKHGRDPTPGEIYLIHQQGPGGAAAHVSNPDELAWKNMYSTAEGRARGPEWAKRAIWGNVPTDVRKRFPGGVDTITSRDFIAIWEDKVRKRGGYGPKGTGGVWRQGPGDPQLPSVQYPESPTRFPKQPGTPPPGQIPVRAAPQRPRFIESPQEPTAGPQPPARPAPRKPYFPQGGGLGGSGPPVEKRTAKPQFDPSLPTPINIPGPDPDRPESLTKPYHWDRTPARDRPEFQGMNIGPRAGRAGLTGTSAMMKRMHEMFPGTYFTGINDDYHRMKQKEDGSGPFFSEHNKHRAGLGLDFGPPPGVSPRQFIETMTKELEAQGFVAGKDFWFNNEFETDSKGKTGPHIHFQWQNQEAANRYAKIRGVPDPVMGVRPDEGTPKEPAPQRPGIVKASAFPSGSSRPQPTEEDLQWVEQHPEDIPKFEKQFGPIKQYFQTEDVPDSRPMETWQEKAGGTAASFLDSLLLGAGDEVIPAVMSVLPGRGTYDEEQRLYRNTETRMQNHPELDIPARLAGGVVAPIGLGGRAAKALVSNPFVKPGAIKQAAKLAGTGALVGGTVGFNEGEGGFSNRVANVPGSAAAGAVLAPMLGAGINSARGIYRAIRPPKVPDPVAARVADAVIGDINAAGGVAPQAGKSLLQQAGPRTTRVADDIAQGGGGEVMVKLAKAIMSTGVKPTGSNLLRWVWAWFKANKEKLTPEQQREVADLLMNPKRLDEAMNRIMNHREWELARIARDARVDNTVGGTAVGVATSRDKNRRKVSGR